MKFYSIPAIVALLAFSASQALSADIPPAPDMTNQPRAAQNIPAVPQASQGAAMTVPANAPAPAKAAAAPALQANPQAPAAPTAAAAASPNDPPRADQWRYKLEGNRWWYWTPQNRWMVYGPSGWVYPDAAGGYTTYYGNTAVAPAPGVDVAAPSVNVVVPGTTYYYGPSYGYYYPRRYYYGGPGVYVGGPRFGVRIGRWWW